MFFPVHSHERSIMSPRTVAHTHPRTLADCIHNQKLVSVRSTVSVLDAARVMTANQCGSVLVVSDTQALVGIFTERDLLAKVVAKELDPAITRISSVMTATPRTAAATMLVSHALLLMRDGGFRHLPVLGNDGALLGVFSMRDSLTSELDDADRITSHQERLSSVL